MWDLDFEGLVAEINDLTSEELALAKEISKVLDKNELSAYEKNKALCVADKVLYHKALG
ncbi:hypothetical protein [Periweissella fabalis]|uniref:Uncharacterized protein n=1 Tax=Periweissella fabalis TaxID=1070421 RepID=A0A7X6N1F1_9LACO|nr:hypothetical protein [Periweissella fabalis]MCM0599190.1 hypothetical protein [Periweissella fabalis]NKZ23469.1 hypothetical protein [Periweissella fabalis]